MEKVILNKLKKPFQNDTLLKVTLALIAIVTLSSCSDFLNGKPKKDDYIELKSSGFACMDELSNNFEKVLNAQGTENEVDESFDCIEKTLSEFQRRVQGRAEADAFNSQEISEIFNTFVKSDSVSVAAADSILVFKSALIGGNQLKITKAEITELKDYLKFVKVEVKNMLPYAKVLKFDKEVQKISKDQIAQAFKQVASSLKALVKASKLINSSYSFENFKSLALNLKLVKGSNVDNKLELAKQVNQLLVGTLTLDSEEEILSYIDSLVALMKMGSLYQQSYAEFEITNSENMEFTLDFLNDLIAIIETSPQYKKNGIIPVRDLDSFVSALTKANVLPFEISEEEALKVYKVAIVRVFDGGLEAVPTINGITAKHMAAFKRELSIYRVFSKLLKKLAGTESLKILGLNRLPVSYVQKTLPSISYNNASAVLNPLDSTTQSTVISQVESFKAELLSSNPTLYRYDRLVLAINQNIWDQNWNDLARGFHTKFLARLLILGWGTSVQGGNVTNAYITESGVFKWYAEFKNLAIALKIFDPRNENLGVSLLTAGNLFTKSGDGDKKMNFTETVQNLASITSGGKIFSDLNNKMASSGCNLVEFDIMGYNWNSETCALNAIKADYKKLFITLPFFVSFLDKLDSNQFNSFFTELIDIARLDATHKGSKVESADLKTMITLIYFMENIYNNHDTNTNYGLSASEIRYAYPKFKTFATEFAEKNSSKDLKMFKGTLASLAGYGCWTKAELIQESFVFLVYHGRTPKFGDLSTAPCYLNKPLIKFTGEVNRANILKAFKIIKEAIGA